MDSYQVFVWDEFNESGLPTRTFTLEAEPGVTCRALTTRVKAMLGWSGKPSKRVVDEDCMYLMPYASCLSAEVVRV